jgi:4-hydroxybutyrate CoA-transferase
LQPLIESGVITNAGKHEFRGKSVATLAAGSASFYRFLHQNPNIVFLPCDRTHDGATLARLSRLTAINGALEVDLSGRINSEAADGQPVSGPGGQPDFSRGAASAPDGKSIIALRATSKDGQTSRIVRTLAPGTPITIDCRDVDYIVTEHGVARVTGLTGSELARALAAIAAPEFRADLLRS